MNDMASVIIPKSDQINADDLIAGPITIKITGVSIRPGQEQPISISFEGDNGKPYKACKSMCRLMVAAWGADSKRYAGRSMTLVRDPSVKWGGMEVGGIRISHMSDIDSAITMALTMTKGSRKPYKVLPLVAQKAEPVNCITPEQAADIETLCLDHEGLLAAVKEKAGIDALAQMPADKYARALAWTKAQITARTQQAA